MKKTLSTLLMVLMLFTPPLTAAASKPTKSWSSRSASPKPTTTKPATGSWWSSSSSKSSATATPPKKSALDILAQKQKMAPAPPVTRVAVAPPPVPKTYGPSRSISSAGIDQVPKGKAPYYKPQQGYGYNNDLGKFVLVDAVTDVISTAVLANQISNLSKPDNPITQKQEQPKHTTTQKSGGEKLFLFLCGLLGVIGVVGLVSTLKSR